MCTAIDRAGRASAALLLLLCTSVQAAEPRPIEYLSVEANEGGSSGGHAAIRFDDTVYHFQHHAPGVLRLHLLSWYFFASFATGSPMMSIFVISDSPTFAVER